MILRLLPHAGESEPWFKVVVPGPGPDAPYDQTLEFGALCGVVSLNLSEPNAGRLDAEVKRAVRAYCGTWLTMELPE